MVRGLASSTGIPVHDASTYHGVGLAAARLSVREHGAAATAEHVMDQWLDHIRVHVLVGVVFVKRLPGSTQSSGAGQQFQL